MGCDNDCFIRKAKVAHASKAKRGIPLLLPISRQMCRHFPESRTSACVMAACEDKHHNFKHFPVYLLFLSFYHWTQHHMVWNVPLVRWNQLSWLCPIPRSCPLASLFALGWGEGKERKQVCKHCSAAAKGWCVINTVLTTNVNHSTIWAAVKAAPSQPHSLHHHCMGYCTGTVGKGNPYSTVIKRIAKEQQDTGSHNVQYRAVRNGQEDE